MNQEQRRLFAKGLVDLANIVAGALVFGQLISSQRFNQNAFIVGILITMIFYLGGYLFSKERGVNL